ncbi:MAG TPA: nitroreductase family protein [Caulobacteraceae bacterium]|nr:nitroreductase family protein [Caulobacteraceae bacterium]
MTSSLPPAPDFGEALPIEARSQAVLDFLARRRSASAATLAAPAPSAAELQDLLRLAARVPDHGKLSPWRFMVLEGPAKAAFVARLEAIAAARPDADKATGALFKIRIPPLTVAVISRITEGKIPDWEQQLSSGAVCMNLLTAAQAMGYGANWITDWYAYDAEAAALLGLAPNERIAGFVHIGTPAEPPLERVRADLDAIVSRWEP